ncbi:MAG: porin family protein [Calditrichia bacterium]
MRKTILIFAFLSSMLSIQAQTDGEQLKDKKVTLGLRTGYEFQANSSSLSYELKLPLIGIWSDFKFSDNWSLQLELNLRSEKRERLFNNGFRESIDELYLTGPVLLKFHLNKKFNIYTGTQVLSASLVNDIFGIKKWNGILGIEYFTVKNIFFDARFRHGFEGQRSINNFRDNRISIGIGYKF